jgi:hypothetical protein
MKEKNALTESGEGGGQVRYHFHDKRAKTRLFRRNHVSLTASLYVLRGNLSRYHTIPKKTSTLRISSVERRIFPD